MSRSVQWRMSVSDSCNWHQSQALNSTIYILRQTGPTAFLLQEEGESKNVKVFLGDPHSCTCPVFKKERDLCKHICWVLLRKFRLSINDPLSWQLGLVEREINEILQGRVTADKNQSKQNKRNAKIIESSDGRLLVEQREIADVDVCPICQEELLSKKLLVTYCKFGCGNSIHIKCMKVWAEHQLKTSDDGKIKCPMCREDFGPFDLLKTEMKNAGYVAPPAHGIRMDRHFGMICSNCGVSPIEGKCYRCTACLTFFLCQRCFNLPVHTDHSFQFRQKRNQKWHVASRILGSGLPEAVINDLMHREISENDYDMLLQLERNSNNELSNLSEEALQSIPIERVREGGALLALGCQCRVCLRGFAVGQYVRKLPCKHKFHKDCIDSWLLHSHPTCPIDGFLIASTQSAAQHSQRNIFHSQTSTENQPQSCHSDLGLALTAVGIPVTPSRHTITTASAPVERCPPHQNSPSMIRLELSGLALGNDTGSGINQRQQKDVAEENLPGRNLLQQAVQHNERMSQQVRKMQRTISSASNPGDLLAPETLIQYLQSAPQPRPRTIVHCERVTSTNQEEYVSSGSSFIADEARTYKDQVPHNHRFQRRQNSLLRRRCNNYERAIPSIQNVREVVGDLFLGNNPATHPVVRENWIIPKPPLEMRSRTHMFRPLCDNSSSSLQRKEGCINIKGNTAGYRVDDNDSIKKG